MLPKYLICSYRKIFSSDYCCSKKLPYVSLFFFVFGLFGTSHIKLISEGQDLDNCNKVYSIIIFFTFILFTLFVFGFYFSEKFYFQKQFTETEEIVIFLSIGLIGVQGLFKVPDITFTALMQQAKINFPKLIRSITFNVGRIVIVLLGFRAIGLVVVNFVSALILLPIYNRLLGSGFFKGEWDAK